MSEKQTLISGTYTVNTKSKGVYIFQETGNKNEKLKPQHTTAKNPSFLAILPHKDRLYFIEEVGDEKGQIKAISFPQQSTDLAYDFAINTQGSAPCHIAISPQEDLLIVSNYMSGNFSCFSLNEQGNIGSLLSCYGFKGKSIHPKRQLQSHIHSAAFSKDGNKVYIQDLGADCIYQFDTEDLRTNNQKYFTFKLTPGLGPRHITISSKNRMYAVNELDGSIEVLQIDDSNMIVNSLQRTALNTKNTVSGLDLGAHIRITRDEKYIYASNRGDRNEITVFEIDEQGYLAQKQIVSSEGIGPRHFEFDSDESVLYVANQQSNTIQKFHRDKKTGLLNYANQEISVPSPVFVAII
ncbi:lactonase family protein [Sphingobacterium paucimobilis]|uniref:6-phosphogluconolactonase n=1 Tax=Sphingobacterium paucimobilis HER1398 TaxID=1346330 RepID=U2HHU3_9SPHI|nr:lactonase family protein [Sphingobacterium paucimobilis]ERJ61326.1 hypothetical protein M472_21460 [Sphingobacterium paucimobilis HER1398]